MKKLIIYTILISTASVFSSCKKFLERSPYDKIDASLFFKSEKDLELYANGFIQRNIPSYQTLTYGDQYADYLASMKSTSYLTGAFTADDQGGWDESSWAELRNINYFLDNIKKAEGIVDEATYRHYVGVGRFWRAWFYYAKVKNFGDVPWYETSIESSDEEQLKKPRDSREFVMNKVLEDITYAAENCSQESKYVRTSSYINKWTALAFKARLSLFEGTYRKYHTELNLQSTADVFLREAVKASEELMNLSPFSLYKEGDLKEAYRKLFTSEEVITQEVIWAHHFNTTLSRFHAATWDYTSATRGNRWSFTKDFVDSYLMLDGSRFTDQPGFETKYFAEEFNNRDYRMAQTMVSPTYMKVSNGQLRNVVPNFAVTLTGYQPVKWNLDNDIYENTTNSNNSLPIFRYAEVLLNYAEAKAELGEMDEAAWNRSIRLLRERAGVNGSAPASADPYLIDYYRNQVSDKWILEIRRERGIEMALENLRWDDIMRWKLADLLVRPWLGIYAVKNQNQDLNNDGSDDLRISDSNAGGAGLQVVVLGDGSNSTFTLSDGNSGNLIWNLDRQWEDYKYLRPIPQVAINRNPNLTQNPGWE